MLVANPSQTDESAQPQKKVNAGLPRAKAFRWGFGIMWIGLLLILIMGIGGDALRGLSPRLGKFVEDLAGLGVIPLLGGVGLMIYSRFLDNIVSALPNPKGPASLPAEKHAITVNPIRRGEPAPSVTEGTTYHLDLPEKGRRP